MIRPMGGSILSTNGSRNDLCRLSGASAVGRLPHFGFPLQSFPFTNLILLVLFADFGQEFLLIRDFKTMLLKFCLDLGNVVGRILLHTVLQFKPSSGTSLVLQMVCCPPKSSCFLYRGLPPHKLTFNQIGREFRLTHIHGSVVQEILA